jgi:hypothetical protein
MIGCGANHFKAFVGVSEELTTPFALVIETDVVGVKER